MTWLTQNTDCESFIICLTTYRHFLKETPFLFQYQQTSTVLLVHICKKKIAIITIKMTCLTLHKGTNIKPFHFNGKNIREVLSPPPFITFNNSERNYKS